jgi:uncharacterized protein YukE
MSAKKQRRTFTPKQIHSYTPHKSKMHFQSALVAITMALSASAAPTVLSRQVVVDQAAVAALSQKVGDLRAVVQQIQQVTGDPAASQISSQFNLAAQFDRLNNDGGDINAAIDAIQNGLKSALDQFSSTENGAAGAFSK